MCFFQKFGLAFRRPVSSRSLKKSFVYIYIYTYIHIHTYICIYIYRYIYIYIYVYTYIHIYTHMYMLCDIMLCQYSMQCVMSYYSIVYNMMLYHIIQKSLLSKPSAPPYSFQTWSHAVILVITFIVLIITIILNTMIKNTTILLVSKQYHQYQYFY